MGTTDTSEFTHFTTFNLHCLYSITRIKTQWDLLTDSSGSPKKKITQKCKNNTGKNIMKLFIQSWKHISWQIPQACKLCNTPEVQSTPRAFISSKTEQHSRGTGLEQEQHTPIWSNTKHSHYMSNRAKTVQVWDYKTKRAKTKGPAPFLQLQGQFTFCAPSLPPDG